MTIDFLRLAALLAGALVLFYSGSSKVLRPTDLFTTLTQLGIPPRLARSAAFGLGLTEIVTAVLVLTPPARLSAALLVALGISFAGAGLVALLRHLDLECHCFGRRSSSTLGWPQLVALPLWLGLAYLAGSAPQQSWEAHLVFLNLGALLLMGVALRDLYPSMAEFRRHKREVGWK